MLGKNKLAIFPKYMIGLIRESHIKMSKFYVLGTYPDFWRQFLSPKAVGKLVKKILIQI